MSKQLKFATARQRPELPTAVRALEPGERYTEHTVRPDGTRTITAVWVKKERGARRHAPTPDPFVVELAQLRPRLLVTSLVVFAIAMAIASVWVSPLRAAVTGLAWGVAPLLILRHFAQRDLAERETVMAKAQRELDIAEGAR